VFKGKTVVVFALPGAFTPTCSSTHVPRYNQLAPELKRRGVDEIVCVSVNDPCEVSDADTMLAYIAPNAAKPLDVTLFTREGRPFCSRAKGILRDAGIQYDELVLNRDYAR
jgi:hypothetical protein